MSSQVESSVSEAMSSEINRLKLEVQTLQSKLGSSTVTIGRYLLDRLSQVGVKVRTVHRYESLPNSCSANVWFAWRLQSRISGELCAYKRRYSLADCM